MARPRIRRPRFPAHAGIHCRHRPHTCIRNRRNHGHLQRGSGGAAAAAVLSRSGAAVAVWDREIRAKGVSKLFDTYQDFENYQRNSRSFDRIAAATWATGPQVVSGRGPARNILAMPVSLGFFPLLGVSPALGRTFVNDDLKLGCAVVVAHRFWQEALGGDAKIVRETLRLNDQACSVVGVMPAGFAFYPEAASMWTLVLYSINKLTYITA